MKARWFHKATASGIILVEFAFGVAPVAALIFYDHGRHPLCRLAAFLDLGGQPRINFRFQPTDSLCADGDRSREGSRFDSLVNGGTGKPGAGFDLLTSKDCLARQRLFQLNGHARYSVAFTGTYRHGSLF